LWDSFTELERKGRATAAIATAVLVVSFILGPFGHFGNLRSGIQFCLGAAQLLSLLSLLCLLLGYQIRRDGGRQALRSFGRWGLVSPFHRVCGDLKGFGLASFGAGARVWRVRAGPTFQRAGGYIVARPSAKHTHATLRRRAERNSLIGPYFFSGYRTGNPSGRVFRLW
jgi:hypothetical protein